MGNGLFKLYNVGANMFLTINFGLGGASNPRTEFSMSDRFKQSSVNMRWLLNDPINTNKQKLHVDGNRVKQQLSSTGEYQFTIVRNFDDTISIMSGESQWLSARLEYSGQTDITIVNWLGDWEKFYYSTATITGEWCLQTFHGTYVNLGSDGILKHDNAQCTPTFFYGQGFKNRVSVNIQASTGFVIPGQTSWFLRSASSTPTKWNIIPVDKKIRLQTHEGLMIQNDPNYRQGSFVSPFRDTNIHINDDTHQDYYDVITVLGRHCLYSPIYGYISNQVVDTATNTRSLVYSTQCYSPDQFYLNYVGIPNDPFISDFIPTTSSIKCIGFGPGVRSADSPYCPMAGDSGMHANSVQVSTMLQTLKTNYNIDRVKIYSMEHYTISYIKAAGDLKIMGTINLGDRDITNNITHTLDIAIDEANSHPAGTFSHIACGNELAVDFRTDLPEAVRRITYCYNRLRGLISGKSLIDQNIKIGTHEITSPFVEKDTGASAVCAASTSGYASLPVDYFGVDIYPFYTNFYQADECPAGTNAAEWSQNMYAVYNRIKECLSQAGNNKPVIIAEAGWPGTIDTINDGCPGFVQSTESSFAFCGQQNNCDNTLKQQFITTAMNTARSSGYPIILFEGFDEPFKNYGNHPWEGSFGLCSAYAPYQTCITI